MNCNKGWDRFARTGLVCDYLQYAFYCRGEHQIPPDNCCEKEIKPQCSASRAE